MQAAKRMRSQSSTPPAGAQRRLLCEGSRAHFPVSLLQAREVLVGHVIPVRAVVHVPSGEGSGEGAPPARDGPPRRGRGARAPSSEMSNRAGMSLPIMTFSFSPRRLSTAPLIADSVSTRVVSWKEAAARKLSMLREGPW